MEFRILIYSQDAQLFLLLQHVLATEGFVSSLASQADELRQLASKSRVDAVVIDSTATRIDLHPLKAEYPQVRFILLSNLPAGQAVSSDEKADAADLVLTRPFNPPLLIQFLRRLRIESLISKGGARPVETLLRYADLEMNTTTVKVCRNGHSVPLTALQFRLLRHLMQNPGAVQTREDLIAACWPPETDVEPRTVDIHMGHIRRALDKFGQGLIRTVRTLGYALDKDQSTYE